MVLHVPQSASASDLEWQCEVADKQLPGGIGQGDLFLVDQGLSEMLTICSGAAGQSTEDKSW